MLGRGKEISWEGEARKAGTRAKAEEETMKGKGGDDCVFPSLTLADDRLGKASRNSRHGRWLRLVFQCVWLFSSSCPTTGKRLSSPCSDLERFQPAAAAGTLFRMMTTRWCRYHPAQGQCDSGVQPSGTKMQCRVFLISWGG